MFGYADVEKLRSAGAPGAAVLSLYLPVPLDPARARGLAAEANALMAGAARADGGSHGAGLSPACFCHGSKKLESMTPLGIFSMPNTKTESHSPERTACTPRRSAAPPLAHPASTLTIGTPDSPRLDSTRWPAATPEYTVPQNAA